MPFIPHYGHYAVLVEWPHSDPVMEPMSKRTDEPPTSWLEFAPDTTAFEEQPPSPGRRWLLRLLCSLVAVLLAGLYWGRLDRQVTAPGQLVLATPPVLVSEELGGRISAVHVHEGDTVAAGDRLLTLADPLPRVLRAPVAGRIQVLATLQPGVRVVPGAPLLSLLPPAPEFSAEIYIRQEDIALIYPGQRVRLKLAAYPSQKHGAWEGRIVAISPEAVAGFPARPDRPFRARLLLSTDSTFGRLHRAGLRPGMLAQAEIKVGEWTLWEYLSSPLRQVGDAALNEP